MAKTFISVMSSVAVVVTYKWTIVVHGVAIIVCLKERPLRTTTAPTTTSA